MAGMDVDYREALASLPVLPMLAPFGAGSIGVYVGETSAYTLWDGAGLNSRLPVPTAADEYGRCPVAFRVGNRFGPVCELESLPFHTDIRGVLVCGFVNNGHMGNEEQECLLGAMAPRLVTPGEIVATRDPVVCEGDRGDYVIMGNDPLVWRARGGRRKEAVVALGAQGDVMCIMAEDKGEDFLQGFLGVVCDKCSEMLRRSWRDILSALMCELEQQAGAFPSWRMITAGRGGDRVALSDGWKADPMVLLLSDSTLTDASGRMLWDSDRLSEGLAPRSREWCVAKLIEGCEASGVPYRELMRGLRRLSRE